MIAALEAGFFRREIADAAFAYQREVDAKRKLIVGVNAFQEAEEKPLETLVIDDTVEKEQVGRAAQRKAKRDGEAVRAIAGRGAAHGGDEGEPDAGADRGGAGALHGRRDHERAGGRVRAL